MNNFAISRFELLSVDLHRFGSRADQHFPRRRTHTPHDVEIARDRGRPSCALHPKFLGINGGIQNHHVFPLCAHLLRNHHGEGRFDALTHFWRG